MSRTPPTPMSPPYTPKIEVTHPNVPDGSQEHLVDRRAGSPPYHGQDNPVFTYETAALFLRAPSRVDPIAPSIDTSAEPSVQRSLPPLRRGSYSPFLPATDKDSLTVPVFGKVWPGMRRQREGCGVKFKMGNEKEGEEGDCISLAELHQCDSDCPLLTEGTCPRAGQQQALPGTMKRIGHSRLLETRLSLNSTRRQSVSSSWGREHSGGAGLLASPKRRLKPLHSLSIDNVTSDLRPQEVSSPGVLSTKSTWSTSDLLATPTPQPDADAMSKHTLSVPRDGTISIFSSETDLPLRSSSELLTIPTSSFCTSSLSNVSGSLGERMHELVRAFSSRTQRCKERISQPPTPSSTSSCDAKSVTAADDQPKAITLGSFLPQGSRTSEAFSDPDHGFVGVGHCRFKLPRWCQRLRFPETMESYSKLNVMWLFVVMLAYVYNSTVIPLRAVFPYQTKANWAYWLMADYISDFIYLLDIVVFKTRLRFTENGVVETNFHQTKKHYAKKLIFKLDLLSLLPLDIFYLCSNSPWHRSFVWLRLPRMLKIQTFWEFYARCDQAAKSSAHFVRIIKTMTYMLYLIHIETCGYYAVSEYEGLNSNRWVYNNQGNAYIRCFYLATKTATSIGNNPKPTNNLEYMFMTLYWLSGVFVFALLIGQIRDIVEAAGQVKDSYRKKMDSALHYMQSINISDSTQDRARKWFLYNWQQSKTIDERSLVTALPKKLRTDLAINVHFNTLIKVQLFQDCELNLLYDLVLKLKPNLFLPGDYVCQKGEVGKEMYIVSQGQVEVVGGENKDVVLATLREGSVFGEISLLAMSGRGNRRTADVRSSGYTNVFTLSKDDFEEAMNEYPEAQKVLKKRAKKLLKENAKKMENKTPKVQAEEIIKTPNDTPKMVKTVIQVLDPQSMTAMKLGASLKRTSASSDTHHLQVPGVAKGQRHPDMARTNMAFDFSDEQVKPSIRTESYDDVVDNVEGDEEEEVLVVETTQHSLPPPPILPPGPVTIHNSDDKHHLQQPVHDGSGGGGDDDDVSLGGQLTEKDAIEEEGFSHSVTNENDVTGSDQQLPSSTCHVQPITETAGPAQRELSHASEKQVDQSKEGRQIAESEMKGMTNCDSVCDEEESENVEQSEVAGRDSGEPATNKTDQNTAAINDNAAANNRRKEGTQHPDDKVADDPSASDRGQETQSTVWSSSHRRHPQDSPTTVTDSIDDGSHDDQDEDERWGGVSQQRAGNMVTVGIGSVSGQDRDLPAVSTSGRLRKINTVSLSQIPILGVALPQMSAQGVTLPQMSAQVTLPQIPGQRVTLPQLRESPEHDEQVTVNGQPRAPAPTIQVVGMAETSLSGSRGCGGESDGTRCPQSSAGPPHPLPPHTQITCAAEIHHDESRCTPSVAMLPMTEQPAPSVTTTSTASTTSTAASSESVAKQTPPTSQSPLPPEMHHMRETIV